MLTNSGICASGESPRPAELRHLRQQDRQAVRRHRHHAALLAVDDRDRRAPVALPRDAPVLQAVLHGPFADRRAPRAAAVICRLASSDGRPSNSPEFTSVPAPALRLGHRLGATASRRPAGRTIGDREAVLARELEVALVVPGNAHDRAGAVLDEHEVRDPDRHGLLRERIDRRPAGVEPFLLDLAGHPRRSDPAPGTAARCAGSSSAPGASAHCLDERMLGREQDEVGAVDRVDARGEDVDVVRLKPDATGISGRCPASAGPIGQREPHASAFGPPDPVPLHRQDLLGPAGQLARPPPAARRRSA